MQKFDYNAFRSIPLPNEEAVMANWEGDLSKPVVSICCATYNHENYIEDAIRGFVLQKTDFCFEIVIHDDASTDSTCQIVREYAERYPQIIRTVFQEENQYSKGVRVMLHTASYATGEFLALCEGDDYWISENKLQMQVDALNNKPGCEICFHSAINTTRGARGSKAICKYKGGEQILDVGLAIRLGGSFMPTASMMIRKTFFDRALGEEASFYKKYLTDYFYQIFCSLNGGALYIDEPMSVYRSMAVGSWSQQMKFDQAHFKSWISHLLISIRAADKKTNYKYTEDFMTAIRRCHITVLNNVGLDVEFRRKYFLKNRDGIRTAGAVLWYSVFRFSLVHRAIRKVHQMVDFNRKHFTRWL